MKKVRYQSPGRKGQITVVGCGNAAGQVIPPLIIFDAKKVKHAWTKDEVPGTKYGVSDKGWINIGLFEAWFNELFLPNAVAARPLLLLLDGHSSHYQPDVIHLARDNEVIILCLPPHTTHATQPLDCGVFSPLKTKWSEVCHEFFFKNPGKVITKFNFNSLFSQAWLKSLVPANLISGFKTCGIYPLNRNAVKPIDYAIETCSANEEHSAIEEPRDESGNSKIFSSEQEELFKKRFEEGYDLCIAPEYNAWLKMYHPDSLVHETLSSGSVVADYLHVAPLSPVPIDTETSSEVTRISLEPSGEDMNASTTTTPSEPSGECINASTTTIPSEPSGEGINASTTTTLSEPSGEGINASTTTTPSEPSGEGINASTTITPSEPSGEGINASTTITPSEPSGEGINASTTTTPSEPSGEGINASTTTTLSEPSGEGINASTTTTPSEPSGEGINASTTITPSKPSGEGINASTTITPSEPSGEGIYASTTTTPSEPSGEGINASTTTTPLEPSGESVNALTTTTSLHASATTAIDGQHTSPVGSTTVTVKNHTQATGTSLSHVLVNHTPKAMAVTPARRSIPKARLLTSAESLALLQEKEAKKQKALEEKEQKRKEREEKKKLREQEAKKKAEEKARKAEEKVRKAAQKEVEKTRKAEQSKGVKPNTRKWKAPQPEASSSTSCKRSNATTDVVESISESSAVGATEENTTSRTGLKETVSESFDPNVCCMCFGNFEDDVLDGCGADWLDCACGRWLHCDCAEDCVTDRYGKKQYCPYCIDGLTNLMLDYMCMYVYDYVIV